MISLRGGKLAKVSALDHLSHFARFVCSFSRVSVRILGGRFVMLVKNLNMNGEFIVEGWKYGLIEVDLMPTLADEITPLLGT